MALSQDPKGHDRILKGMTGALGFPQHVSRTMLGSPRNSKKCIAWIIRGPKHCLFSEILTAKVLLSRTGWHSHVGGQLSVEGHHVVHVHHSLHVLVVLHV